MRKYQGFRLARLVAANSNWDSCESLNEINYRLAYVGVLDTRKCGH